MIQVTIGKIAVVQKTRFSCIHLATICAQVYDISHFWGSMEKNCGVDEDLIIEHNLQKYKQPVK